MQEITKELKPNECPVTVITGQKRDRAKTAEKPFPIAIFDNLNYIKAQTFSAHELYQKLEFVRDDFKYGKQFLLSYAGSEDTYNAYRREIERYLQWAWLIKSQSIQAIKRADFEMYLEFCQQPFQEWINKQQEPRFIFIDGIRQPNDAWRPFILAKEKRKYTMSQAAWKSLFAVLGSFYQYLIDEEYTEINPVSQIRQKSQFIRKQTSKQLIRRLTELQWDYVIETAEKMAKQNKSHERTLFVMSCLYGMYLRISELVASTRWVPQMGHFYQDQDGDWWFKTVSKGNKERDISVSEAMLSALKHYRKHLKLPPLPSRGESTPLLNKNHGEGPMTSTRQVRRIVQACFDQAIERMKEDNFIEEAEQLKSATVHWLRHTGISDDVKHRPREHVRDDAGHCSSAITDKYIDIELKQRHATAKEKRIKN